jgi:hypothetical protein
MIENELRHLIINEHLRSYILHILPRFEKLQNLVIRKRDFWSVQPFVVTPVVQGIALSPQLGFHRHSETRTLVEIDAKCIGKV